MAGKVEFYFNVLFIDAVTLYRKSLTWKNTIYIVLQIMIGVVVNKK